MKRISLDGSWTLKNCSGKPEFQTANATVPGCVHTDLLNAELIPDPYFRDNELNLMWIGEDNWSYSRTFTVDSDLAKSLTQEDESGLGSESQSELQLPAKQILLCCEGLDTFAEVILNGTPVATTNNMFRHFEWDVKEHLQAGENTLEIIFTSPLPYGRKCQEENYLKHTGIGHHRLEGGNWVRKEACNYGWDWGPMLVTAGIWKSIYLSVIETSRIEDLAIEPVVFADNSAVLKIKAQTTPTPYNESLKLKTTLCFEDAEVATSEITLDASGQAEYEIALDQVNRWWPAGMGDQPLYEVSFQLMSADGQMIDEDNDKRIGFRDLELITEFDEWGQSFNFRANGVDFFAKGANWIPADTFTSRIKTDEVRDILQSAVEAHMNCIRVWGGGLYESNDFYRICDELGICVWQDFMFACSAYPAHLPDFMENVMVEAEQNVKRLHHHTSLFLWCGNNELEHMNGYIGDDEGAMRWDHYVNLFDIQLRKVVETYHPQSNYWPASEHSPVGNRTPHTVASDPRWGDAHLWDVWHGRQPFEWYRGSFHRFCSEFGFQALPHPATLDEVLLPEDQSITSHVMEHHQRSPDGNQAIISYMLEWFRLPVGFENTIWLSQILQGLGIKYAVEHWRRNMPRCMGATYWQLNDCWPVASWSSIDSSRRWKALHYEAKRFFAPEILSVIENPEEGTIEIYITSDFADEQAVTIRAAAWNAADGKELTEAYFEAQTPSNGSKRVTIWTPDMAALSSESDAEGNATVSDRDIIFQFELKRNGMTVAENMITWVRPKHINLQKPAFETTFGCDDEERIYVDISTDKPALWVWFDAKSLPDLRWSDQFFHLYPNQKKRVYLHNPGVTQLETLASQLKVQSLWHTYQN